MTPAQAGGVLREVFGGATAVGDLSADRQAAGGGVTGASFRVRLWDGSEIAFGQSPAFTLVFRDEGTFADLFRSQDSYKFAVAFVEDRFDIEGDFFAALRLKDILRGQEPDLLAKFKVLLAFGLRSRHSKSHDAKDVQAHYDISNDFYRLMLDSRAMAYSCAYFHRPDEALEDAQEHKADLICRKLRLEPGERFLDIGCGWGGLVIHAAKHYGVTAHGLTLSQNQFELAQKRAADAGVADKVKIERRDYRDLAAERYDKIASVGMYEHVGVRQYPVYFGAAWRLLADGGLFLNHGITSRKGSPLSGEAKFLFTYIFPNAELDSVSHAESAMEDAGFEILNTESLRPHYALTLREWWRRLTSHEDEALRLVPKHIYRAWKLYIAGSALAFEDGRISVYQTLAAKTSRGPAKVPLTPHDVYC